MDKNSKIYIAGHRGIVGSALLRRLKADGYKVEIVWDTAKPDGTPRKLLDVSKIRTIFSLTFSLIFKWDIIYVIIVLGLEYGKIGLSKNRKRSEYNELVCS